MPSQAYAPPRAQRWILVLSLPGVRAAEVRAADADGALASVLAPLRPAALLPPGPAGEGKDEDLAPASIWLARRLGFDSVPVPTAPYAWAALAATATSDPAPVPDGPSATPWRAHCDIVRLTPARDGFQLHPVDPGAIAPEVRGQMFDIARERITQRGWSLHAVAALPDRTTASVPQPGTHAIQDPGGAVGPYWFLESARPWDYEAAGVARLRSQPHSLALPRGQDARAWRLVSDAISMDWHALLPEHGAATAGPAQGVFLGLWLHGGGTWRASTRSAPLRLQTRDPTLLGWHAAAPPQVRSADPTAGDLLECDLDALGAGANRARSIARRVQASLHSACAQGYREFELVLCTDGAVRALRARIDGPAWLRALRAHLHPRTRIEDILPP